MTRPLRIAQVAPPFERVPPRAYGGTERIVHELVVRARPARPRRDDLRQRRFGRAGPARRDRRRRPSGRPAIAATRCRYMLADDAEVLDRATEFDLIHAHLEWASPLLARVVTRAGRHDVPRPARPAVGDGGARATPPAGLVAISANQASTHPDVPWTDHPQRPDPRRRAVRAAPRRRALLRRPGRRRRRGSSRRSRSRRRPAGRCRSPPRSDRSAAERDYYDAVFRPALEAAGSATSSSSAS